MTKMKTISDEIEAHKSMISPMTMWISIGLFMGISFAVAAAVWTMKATGSK